MALGGTTAKLLVPRFHLIHDLFSLPLSLPSIGTTNDYDAAETVATPPLSFVSVPISAPPPPLNHPVSISSSVSFAFIRLTKAYSMVYVVYRPPGGGSNAISSNSFASSTSSSSATDTRRTSEQHHIVEDIVHPCLCELGNLVGS